MGFSPQIRVRRREHHRIPCPYCRGGFGVFTVIREGGEVDGEAQDPIPCNHCQRFFLVQPMIKLVGRRIEDADADVQRRNGYVR